MLTLNQIVVNAIVTNLRELDTENKINTYTTTRSDGTLFAYDIANKRGENVLVLLSEDVVGCEFLCLFSRPDQQADDDEITYVHYSSDAEELKNAAQHIFDYLKSGVPPTANA